MSFATLLLLLQLVTGCAVAEVAVVCVALYIQFGQFNAFLLLSQIEVSEGTSAITVTKGVKELIG